MADARWAPSPHNTQAWLVEARDDETALLRAARERLLPVEDTNGRFWAAGLGIFVEALDIAARERGLAVHAELTGASLTDEEPFAHLRLERGAESPLFSAALLQERRTSRLPYDGRGLPGETLEQLQTVAANAGQHAQFSSDPDVVAWVVGLNRDTLFYDLDEADRREEIKHWVRFSEQQAGESADGFSPACLGFHPVLVRLFFNHYGLMSSAPVRRVFAAFYGRSMKGTATVGWIKGPFATREQCFAAGRMLLRFWLTATAAGAVLQPFGSVITNPTAHSRLAERLSIAEDADQEVWLLLRLGYSRLPPRSARLGAERILR